MPVAAAAAVVGIGGSIYSANQQKKAAQSASNAQTQANNATIAEQQRQFNAYQQLLQPYVGAGNQALSGEKDLLGLNGYDSQQSAINNIQNSPFFQSQYQQAENAILQNASATGGLRGGNLQSALANNRMNMLYQNVQGQMQNLGALTSIGQNAAAGVGNQGMNMASNIGNAYQNTGQAQASYALAQGQASQNMMTGFNNAIGAAIKPYNTYSNGLASVNNLVGNNTDYGALSKTMGWF